MTATGDVMVREGGTASALHVERGINTALLGMLLFISSEVMFFAGLFAVYFNIRASHHQWPPEGSEHFGLNPIVIVATTLLIISSFTMQWGVARIRRDDRTGMNRALVVTLVLGILFLSLQALDYSILYGEGIRLNSGIFGSLFYTMTGFHGAHVFGGVVGISVMLLRGVAGQFSARHHVAVEAVSIYWHFVDVVWIALFTTLYLLR
jgi:cytochrome c oxidase subunit III